LGEGTKIIEGKLSKTWKYTFRKEKVEKCIKKGCGKQKKAIE